MERYTIPALIIIVSLGIFFGFIRGTYAKIEQGIKQKEELVNYLDQAKTAKSKLDKLSDTVKNFPPDAEKKLAVMIPESIDEVTLYMQFQELSKNSGIIFNDAVASMGKNNGNDPYVINQMSFSVDTTYPAFRKFLRVIEKSLALRELGSVSFVTTKKVGNDTKNYRAVDPETATYNYTVAVSSYSIK